MAKNIRMAYDADTSTYCAVEEEVTEQKNADGTTKKVTSSVINEFDEEINREIKKLAELARKGEAFTIEQLLFLRKHSETEEMRAQYSEFNQYNETWLKGITKTIMKVRDEQIEKYERVSQRWAKMNEAAQDPVTTFLFTFMSQYNAGKEYQIRRALNKELESPVIKDMSFDERSIAMTKMFNGGIYNEGDVKIFHIEDKDGKETVKVFTNREEWNGILKDEKLKTQITDIDSQTSIYTVSKDKYEKIRNGLETAESPSKFLFENVGTPDARKSFGETTNEQLKRRYMGESQSEAKKENVSQEQKTAEEQKAGQEQKANQEQKAGESIPDIEIKNGFGNDLKNDASAETKENVSVEQKADVQKEDVNQGANVRMPNDVALETITTVKDLDSEILDKFSQSEDVRIRRAVAQHPNTSEETLIEMTSDKDETVRSYAEKRLSGESIQMSETANAETIADKEVPEQKSANVGIREEWKNIIENGSVEERMKLAEAGYNSQEFKEALSRLAKDENDLVREIVAKRSDTPSETLKELAKDEALFVREAVALNKNTPIETRKELANNEEEGTYVRQAASATLNASLNASASEKVDVQSLSPAERYGYAKREDTSGETLREIAKIELSRGTNEAYNADTITALCKHPNTPADAISDILNVSKEERLAFRRGIIARRGDLSEDMYKVLAKDSDASVRAEIARNAHTPSEILQGFAKDKDENVVNALCRNQSASKELLTELHQQYGEKFKSALTNNPNCPDNVLRSFMDDERTQIRMNVAAHPNLSDDIGLHLCKDANEQVRSALALNTASDAVLAELKKDPSERVQECLQKRLENENAEQQTASANVEIKAEKVFETEGMTETKVVADVKANADAVSENPADADKAVHSAVETAKADAERQVAAESAQNVSAEEKKNEIDREFKDWIASEKAEADKMKLELSGEAFVEPSDRKEGLAEDAWRDEQRREKEEADLAAQNQQFEISPEEEKRLREEEQARIEQIEKYEKTALMAGLGFAAVDDCITKIDGHLASLNQDVEKMKEDGTYERLLNGEKVTLELNENLRIDVALSTKHSKGIDLLNGNVQIKDETKLSPADIEFCKKCDYLFSYKDADDTTRWRAFNAENIPNDINGHSLSKDEKTALLSGKSIVLEDCTAGAKKPYKAEVSLNLEADGKGGSKLSIPVKPVAWAQEQSQSQAQSQGVANEQKQTKKASMGFKQSL